MSLGSFDPCALAAGADPDGTPDLLFDGSYCLVPNQGHRRLGYTYLQTLIPYQACFPGPVAFGDINGDGRLDSIDLAGVFLGHGDGHFGVQTVAFVNLVVPLAFASADLDRDGFGDVVVGGYGARIFYGGPDGTLRATQDPLNLKFESGKGLPQLRLVDLDGDDLEDLMGSSDQGPLLAFQGEARSFEESLQRVAFTRTAQVADMDLDGRLDVVTVGEASTDGTIRQRPHVHVYFGEGLKSLGKPVLTPIESLRNERFYAMNAAVGDVNRDGKPDIVTTSRWATMSLFLGDGSRALGPEDVLELPVGDYATALLIHDLDADGMDDLVVSYAFQWTHVYWGAESAFVDFLEPTFLAMRGVSRISIAPPVRGRFLRGDADMDGRVALSDAARILEQLFGGHSMDCGDASDADDSGIVDLTDAVYLLQYLFAGGAKPPYPFPYAGGDFSSDVPGYLRFNSDLGCSPQTYSSDLYQPCSVDAGPAECAHPILQRIDVGLP